MFDFFDTNIRNFLADSLISGEEYVQAARILSGMNIDKLSEELIAAHYVKITELFLEQDETVDAEIFVNNISKFPNSLL